MGEVGDVANLVNKLQSDGEVEIIARIHSAKTWAWGFLVPFPVTTPSFLKIDLPLTCKKYNGSYGCAPSGYPVTGETSLGIDWAVNHLKLDTLTDETSGEVHDCEASYCFVQKTITCSSLFILSTFTLLSDASIFLIYHFGLLRIFVAPCLH